MLLHVLCFQFRIWSREEALNQTVYALKAGIEALEFYEDYYNISFPLKKQGDSFRSTTVYDAIPMCEKLFNEGDRHEHILLPAIFQSFQ